ncbi:phosphotransferase enzyme family protein [Kribbella sp. NPDC051586]|uniref:phosphotransferase enzyme family protein n=1 Tax=Kribbella sp. NPDC051586 TaxID=3364118 RepID=UPI0037BA9FBE
MYTPAAEEIAVAFGLGEPVGELVRVRRGDADTWRLETVGGSYFVKGFVGFDRRRVAVGMGFEGRVREAGVDVPEPIAPIDPLLGWVARIGARPVRVYRWVEGVGERDVSVWLGRTMARVHQVQPVGQVGLPEWWRAAVHPAATWEGWFARAEEGGAAWAGLRADSVPHILAVTERITELCDVAPDIVTTHGDFKPHNLVMSASGPVLVDWDSVRTDSAALEAGRAAYIFGDGEAEQTNRILDAYVAAGGELGWTGPDLFLSVARHHIQVLAEQIRVSLGEATAIGWMGDRAAREAAIADLLRELPAKLEALSGLARDRLGDGVGDGSGLGFGAE